MPSMRVCGGCARRWHGSAEGLVRQPLQRYCYIMGVDVDLSSNSATEVLGAAKALVKGLAMLDLLTAHPDGLRLTDIVQKSGVPKATTLRLLDALVTSNAVAVDSYGVYRLGARCASWGSAFLDSIDIRRIAHDTLAGLAELTAETCHLGVLEGLQVLYADKIDGKHSVRMFSRIGGTNPLYCTGLGKAMLAFLPEDQATAVAEGELEPRTENTITDADALIREMAATRRRGYSIDDVENEDGVRCVGAPIFDHHNRVVASISVAGPAYRMTREQIRAVGPRVRKAADEVSLRLGCAEPGRSGPPVLQEGG
jgi:DNA-binding IclR family transcriptional regulator